MNHKSIQVLRGSSTYDPKTSTEVLLDGQPFYSKKTKKLYIGDGVAELKDLQGTGIGLNFENSEGSGSIQQKVYNEDLKNPKATGLGAIAFGGVTDKLSEEYTTTTASGIQAFATGVGNLAQGNWSAVFGMGTKAYRRQDIAIGGLTQAGMTEVEYADRYKNTPDENKPDYNDDFSGALATGESTKALARASATFGFNTVTEGERSIAAGIGAKTGSGAPGSLACGEETVTKSKCSSTFGYKTSTGVNAPYAAVFGVLSEANAKGSFVAGNQVKANTEYQAVFGIRNAENPNALFIVGNGGDSKRNAFEILKDGRVKVQSAPSEDNDVLRWQEKKELEYRIDEEISSLNIQISNLNIQNGTGLGSLIQHIYSDSDKNSKATGLGAIAFGDKTIANGKYSIAAGIGAFTGGEAPGSLACGEKVATNSKCSFAFGYDSSTGTDAPYSAVFGQYSQANARGSFAAGNEAIANTAYQAVFGQRNADNSNALFIIGNGGASRRNAFEVLKDGRAKVYGEPVEDTDVVRLQDTKKLHKHRISIGKITVGNATANGYLEFITNTSEQFICENNRIYTNCGGDSRSYRRIISSHFVWGTDIKTALIFMVGNYITKVAYFNGESITQIPLNIPDGTLDNVISL